MLLTARWLLPVAAPPIKEGAILVEGDTIRDIGTRKWFAKRDISDVVDLGETILLPGLVNAHCHLEHSAMRGSLTAKSFSSWIRSLQQKSAQTTQKEKEEAIQNAIRELIRGGTTSLVDHRSPEAGWFRTPFRELVILEVLGASETRARASVAAAKERLQSSPDETVEISPHSLYAVHPQILQNLTLRSIHLLESEEEEDFFRHGHGPLADLVRERDGLLPFPDPSPVHWLHERGQLQPGLLLAHGNYLTNEEIRLLRGSGVTVIHCPGSWRYFGHRRLPLQSLFYNEVRIAIGTDSLASNDSLNMLKQLKLMKATYPSLGEEDLLKMATFNGAHAIGLSNEIGLIEPGKKADLIGIPYQGNADPYESLLLADEVNFSMVGGRRLTPLS